MSKGSTKPTQKQSQNPNWPTKNGTSNSSGTKRGNNPPKK